MPLRSTSWQWWIRILRTLRRGGSRFATFVVTLLGRVTRLTSPAGGVDSQSRHDDASLVMALLGTHTSARASRVIVSMCVLSWQKTFTQNNDLRLNKMRQTQSSKSAPETINGSVGGGVCSLPIVRRPWPCTAHLRTKVTTSLYHPPVRECCLCLLSLPSIRSPWPCRK